MIRPVPSASVHATLVLVAGVAGLAGSARAQAFRPGLEAPGLAGGVYALLGHDDGGGIALYVGGEFEAAGPVVAPRIARWRNGTWSAVGGGMDGRVAALVAFDEDGAGPQPAQLVAGGEFLHAGAAVAQRVARWDGAAWTPLGAGFDDAVTALATWDEDGSGPAPRRLYAAGAFRTSGTTIVQGIARWNGVAWQPLGAGLDAPATALATFDPDGPLGPAPEGLFVGGFFERAGGVLANGVARWNGLSWSPLSSGVLGGESAPSVQSLATFDPDGAGPQLARLFVGGSFAIAGGANTSGAASWDGSTFSSMQGGVSAGGSFPALRAFATFDDGGGARLVATGLVRSAGAVTVNADAFDAAPLLAVARWDGASWSALGVPGGSAVNGVGRALCVVDDDGDAIPSLFVGGFFGRTGAVGTASVAKWTGAAWAPLGNGLGADGAISALAAQPAPGAPVVVGGEFAAVGNQLARRVAAWNDAGGAWTPLGAGFDGDVRSVHVHAGAIHAGGSFESSGPQPLARLARFDGGNWVPVGGGTDGDVLALTTFGADLAVGGAFRRAGGAPTGPVALWNGASWVQLPNGPDGIVRALASFDDGSSPALYAGGDFTRAGGAGASGVARWTGTGWQPVGGGLCCGSVHAFAVHDAGSGFALYAGGDFDLDGDGDVDGVARWNPLTQAWTPLGTGFGGGSATSVRALASWNVPGTPFLVAGGDFDAVEGLPARNLARFGPGGWAPFGSGADGIVRALLAKPVLPSGTALFAGGAFGVIDGRPSARFARTN